jgi:flagellum-specific peptidoglycan hydrolase FlgJ
MTTAQKQFIDMIGQAARQHYPIYKILPSLTIAQAILESAWGKSGLSRKAYNYFGMKAGAAWKGATYNSKTQEQTVAGQSFTINADFRAYTNVSDGIKGYYEFLQYPRYANLKGVTDYKLACTLIKQDGWATDVSYTAKLVSLIEKYGLSKYDQMEGKEDEEMVKRYNTIEEIPVWAQATIKKLISKGCIADANKLDLSDDMIRGFVINDRAGLYK